MRDIAALTAGWGGAGDLVAQICQTGEIGHAYLLVGPASSAKARAAEALAHLAVDALDDLLEGREGCHPDIHTVAPAGAAGYLVDQVRDLLNDVQLSPIRSPRKAYILTDAQGLNSASANAFLKNLEEPPADTAFILLAASAQAVLSTITSRCQVMRFPARDIAAAAVDLARTSGYDEARCRRALAFCMDAQQAVEFMGDARRWAIRTEALAQIAGVGSHDDIWCMRHAASLEKIVKDANEGLREAQEQEYDQAQQILGAGALKDMSDRHKRQLSFAQRSGIMAALRAQRAFLRDALHLKLGRTAPLSCDDCLGDLSRISQECSQEELLRAIETVGCAMRHIERNVLPRLAIEGMLLDLKEIHQCRP